MQKGRSVVPAEQLGMGELKAGVQSQTLSLLSHNHTVALEAATVPATCEVFPYTVRAYKPQVPRPGTGAESWDSISYSGTDPLLLQKAPPSSLKPFAQASLPAKACWAHGASAALTWGPYGTLMPSGWGCPFLA